MSVSTQEFPGAIIREPAEARDAIRRTAVSGRRATVLALVCSIFFSIAAISPAPADEVFKVGVMMPFTGYFADSSGQIDRGIRVFMDEHGDTVAGRKIEIIRRDNGGSVPNGRRIAQELVVREKVDALAGFLLTPVALAAADIATQAKVPMIVMNAQGASVPGKSPYVVRVASTVQQSVEPIARWAFKNGITRVYTAVNDFAPGHDAEKAFVQTFKDLGGTIVGSVRLPVEAIDVAPYMQKIKDSRPQAVFAYVVKAEGFMKAVHDENMEAAGIKILATGELTDDRMLKNLQDSTIGTVTAHHYSFLHDSPMNQVFVGRYRKLFGPNERPSFLAVGGYDGMAALYAALEKTNGKSDGDELMKAFAGLKLESPRGPIEIDANTRDIIQTIYIRKVEKVGGELGNVEFDSTARVDATGVEHSDSKTK